MTATQIPLRTLLCQVYEHQLKRESNCWQYAARLSLSEIDFTEHAPELRSQLEALANGDMAVDDAKRHETLASIVRGKLRMEARDETLKQEARRLGRAAHGRTTWQVLGESIVSAAEQIKSSLRGEDPDWLVRSYCERVLADRVDAYEPFDAAVEQLDHDNFTASALKQLWDECEAECREIPLPNPADGLAETTKKAGDGTKNDVTPEQLEMVTLNQMAAHVNKSKRTLEDHKKDLPKPHIKGGHGKADEWLYKDVKPILERLFNRKLPERPKSRFSDS